MSPTDAEALAELDRALLGVETGTPVLRRDEHGWWLSVEGGPRVYSLRLDAYDGDDPMLARVAMWRWKWQGARWEADSEAGRREMAEAVARARKAARVGAM